MPASARDGASKGLGEGGSMHLRSTRCYAAPLLLAVVTTGCDGGGGNKLMGSWQLMPGRDCAVDRITFTSANAISRYGPDSYYAGQESTAPVAYLVDGPRVTATTRDGATSVTYVFSDDDHMSMGDQPECAFERVG